MTTYRHTQFGTVVVVSMVAPLVILVVASSLTYWHPVAFAVGAVLLLTVPLFWSLGVEIDEEKLRCKLGIGLIRRTFALEDIVSAEPVRNKWYYGWGIRYLGHGWMYNVSGFDAVEIETREGTRFRIGTDEPEALVRAIRAHLPQGR